ncbi:uncharacterized protein [Trachinotus anak]|uniref:uncharacterized protein isoform X2 n=1 Tax=Trachinotus anak TaxID=443729 RepID=UPI0039F229A7
MISLKSDLESEDRLSPTKELLPRQKLSPSSSQSSYPNSPTPQTEEEHRAVVTLELLKQSVEACPPEVPEVPRKPVAVCPPETPEVLREPMEVCHPDSSSEPGLFGNWPEPEWAKNVRLVMERREPFDRRGCKRPADSFYIERMTDELLGLDPAVDSYTD